MKKINPYFMLLLGLVISVSCTKQQDLDITMNIVNSGDLKIQVVDNAGAPINSTEVILYDYPAELERKTTAEDGWITFKDILVGSYEIRIEDIVVGGKNYNVSQGVQVINGVTKEYIIDPSDYSGTVTIMVMIYDFDLGANIPAPAGLNVSIFSTEDYSSEMGFNDMLDISIDGGITNADGEVTFIDLPLDYYGVIVYESEDYFEFDEYYFDINYKGQEKEIYYYYSY